MARQPREPMGKGIEKLFGNIDPNQLRKPVTYQAPTYVNEKPEDPRARAGVMLISAELIEPNPFQPRISFDNAALEELAESIRSLGLVQPITVRRKADGRYQIISGERRFRACRMNGMEEIPVYVRDTNDQGMLEMAIVENIQREDLDPIEVAMSYQRLIDECDLTQEQMAVRVGKKRASVTNYLRLLKLPAKIQHDLKVGLIDVGHAKVLLGVEDEALQEKLCDAVIREGMSVRQLEERVHNLASGGKKKDQAEPQDLPEEWCRLLESVGKYFKNDISLKRGRNGKGTMTIKFASDEEVNNFLKAIGKFND